MLGEKDKSRERGYTPFYNNMSLGDAATLEQAIRKSSAKEKSKIDLVNSCASPEQALEIISNRKLFASLSIEKQLNIIAWHPEIAEKMLIEIGQHLPAHLLYRLGTKSLRVAQFILSNHVMRSKLGSNIELLGSEDLEIAKYLMLHESGLLTIAGFRSLGFCHQEIAECILNSKMFCDELSGFELGSICSKHELIAQRVLDTPALRAKLDANALRSLYKHEKIAMRILTEPDLACKLDSLNCFGDANEAVALYILNTPFLLEKLRGEDLVSFRKHPRCAQIIINTPGLLRKILSNRGAVTFFAHENETFAKELFSKSSHTLGSDTLEALCVHPSIAAQIFVSPNLYKKLDTDAIVRIGRSNLALSKHILKVPQLASKLMQNHLWLLGKKQPTVIERTIDTTNFTGISSADLGDVQHAVTAELMCSRPQITQRLSRAQLAELSAVARINQIAQDAYKNYRFKKIC